jgi:nicotinate-nucleotide pyrophosphorylase (carboxylating)
MSDPFHDLEEIITTDVTRALQEDVRHGDLTASLIPAHARGVAGVITRQDCVVAGTEWFERCYTELDPDCEVFWHFKDGDSAPAKIQLCEIQGNARTLLTAERASLNFLQLLSGVATKTRRFVDAVSGTRAKIYDTRKTLPGLRMAEKYAVRAGGGVNHRIGLFDGILIKENHILAAGGVAPALKAAFDLVKHGASAGNMVEIEVETLGQLKTALDCGCRLVLLDNFALDEVREAVNIAAKYGGGAELEASGGVTLETVRAIAQTGVHRISVGSLTKDIEAVDLSLRFAAH